MKIFQSIIKSLNEKSTEQDQSPSNPKVTIKLLRLLNMLTSISLKNDRIKDYVKRHTKTEQISKLITILLKCSIREGTIVLAILSNFVEVGISIKVFDIALKSISTLNIVQTISKLTTKSEFPSEFLQLMFNLLLQIRSYQWREEKSQPKGKYSLSCGIVRFFKRILRSDQQLSWRDEIEQVLDNFLIKAEEYSLEEFDATTSLFEGGEYLGMTIGSHGVTEDDQKFTIVGFIDKWGNSKDSRSEQSNFDHQALSTEYILDHQKILAIPHDEDSSHKNVFLCNPDEVTLIPNIEHLPKTVDFSDAIFTDEQKILFEIFCCLRVLEQKYPNVKCSYTYPEYLLEIEKYVQILKETNDFNLLSYLLYFEKNGLAKREDNKIILTNSEENFDYEECSKYAISQCKKISIALDKDSEFAKGASILFSKDPEGKLPHILIHEPEDALGKKFDIILSPTYNLFNEAQDLRQNTPIYFHNENAKKNSNSISNSQKILL